MKKLLCFLAGCCLLLLIPHIINAQCEASNTMNPPSIPPCNPTQILIDNHVIDPPCTPVGDPELDPTDCVTAITKILSKAARASALHLHFQDYRNPNACLTPCLIDRDSQCFKCFQTYSEEIEKLVEYEATYISAYGFWDGDYRQFIPGRDYYNKLHRITCDINTAYDCAGLRRPVIGIGLLSTLTEATGNNGVSEICIPAWVINAFSEANDPEFDPNDYILSTNPETVYRNFNFNNIRKFEQDGPNIVYKDYWDVTRIEARMWMYYMMITLVEFNFKVFEMGETRWLKTDTDFVHTRKLFQMVRDYATSKGTFALFSGENLLEGGGSLYGRDLTYLENGERHLLFDFDVVPARFRELDDPMAGYTCCEANPPQDVVDEWTVTPTSPCFGDDYPAFLDFECSMNVLRTKIEPGGHVISPRGCYFSEVPYSVNVDVGVGINESCPGTVGEVIPGWDGGVYCYDDMYWLTQILDTDCAAFLLKKWICELNDYSNGLGSLQIPWSYQTPAITGDPVFFRLSQIPELFDAIKNPPTVCPYNNYSDCDISVTPHYLEFSQQGGNQTFSFTTTCPDKTTALVITGNPWITIDNLSASNIITVTCSVNNNIGNRNGYIELECGSSAEGINIIQAGLPLELPFSCKSNPVASIPHNESFEATTSFWVQDTDDDMDWTRNSGGTLSSGTGPSAASDGSFYMYTEASLPPIAPVPGSPNKEANLVSPCLDLRETPSPEISFDYHMNGVSMGTLELQVSTNGGLGWSTLWYKSGDQGNVWHPKTVSLSNYTNGVIRLRFHAVTGADFKSDMAIDAIQVSSALACFDQYEQNNSFSTAYSTTIGSLINLPNACLYAGDDDFYLFYYFNGGAQPISFFVKVNGATSSIVGDYQLSLSIANGNLTVETLPQNSSTTDTYLSLYSNSESPPVAVDDNSGSGLFSKIIYPISNIGFRSDTDTDKPSAKKATKTALTIYPNPFTQKTTFSFFLNQEREVSLVIRDVDGKIVAQVIQDTQYGEGNHLIEFDGSHLPEGVYYYTLQTDFDKLTKSMIIIR